MAIADVFLAELEHESKITRKFLERVPALPDYKPHPKSMALGRLAGHLAEMPTWGLAILRQDVFVLDPSKYTPAIAPDGPSALAEYEKNLAEFKSALKGTSDVRMAATWKMMVGGKVALEMPRAAVLRSMVMNHTVHHRAQLGVYLRLNNIAVPSSYGPSSDEA